MHVIVNGKPVETSADVTIRELASSLGLEGPIAVEVNREIVTRAKHAEHRLAEGDAIEIVQFVGGG